jgi:hypothetical protein
LILVILTNTSQYQYGIDTSGIVAKPGVVKAPQNCRYAALSYVWSTTERAGSNVDKGDEGSTLDSCPKVIRDSMEAAVKLKLRYLWVDRFCIDQQNAHEKHVQISQMEDICECSTYNYFCHDEFQ